MNKKITSVIGIATAAALVASIAVPFVSAEDNISTSGDNQGNISGSVQVNLRGGTTTRGDIKGEGNIRGRLGNRGTTTATTTIAKNRGDQEITMRVAALNKLIARVQAMKHITDADKTSVVASIQAQITILNNLKTKIDADTDAATLKADIESITKSLRIYALVMPQINIMAAADRLTEIGTEMTTIGAKLQTRITALQTAGKDVTSIQAALTDFNSKIADANVQGQAAITASASLTPDNGDAAKAAANRTALEGARAKIKAGTADLRAARKDADTILKGLKALEPRPTHTGTTTASTTVHDQ